MRVIGPIINRNRVSLTHLGVKMENYGSNCITLASRKAANYCSLAQLYIVYYSIFIIFCVCVFTSILSENAWFCSAVIVPCPRPVSETPGWPSCISLFIILDSFIHPDSSI